MEPPYVMISRTTSLDGLIVLCDFDAKKISKWRSEDLRKEFPCLALLKWETIARYGARADVEATKAVLAAVRGTKRKLNGNDGPARSRAGRDLDSIAGTAACRCYCTDYQYYARGPIFLVHSEQTTDRRTKQPLARFLNL